MLFLLFVLVVPLFLFFLLQKQVLNSNAQLPPGPKGLPFIGNLHQIDKTTPHRYLWQLSQKYGPLMSLRLGCVPTIVVSSAKLATEVLKTHDLSFCSRPSLLGQQKLSYNGLDVAFAPYNDYWREMRKICTIHLFSSTRVQAFRPIREDKVARLLEKISKSAAESTTIDLSEAMMSLTSSIICRVAFGKRYEDKGVERSRFKRLLNETEAVLASFYFTDHFPYFGWVDKLTGLMGRLERIFKEMDMFY